MGGLARRMICPMLAVAAMAAAIPAAKAATGAPRPAPVEPILTRQMGFVIPFEVDRSPAPHATAGPEVHLHVSADRGSSWRLHGTAAAGQRRFRFRAPSEGEYWFKLVSADALGRTARPEGEGSQLRVIVDATPPRLRLETARGRAGQLSAQWRIEEPHFHPQRATLQYREGPEDAWQTVAVDPASFHSDGEVHTGQVTWWPKPGHQPVQVRMEVIDAADNRAVSHAKIDAPESTAAGVSWPADRVGDAATAARPDVPTRAIDSHLFELEYDLSAVAAADVDAVELWATRDRGESWQRYQTDRDHRSPLLVRMNRDGWYGFRIVVAGPDGRRPRPPQDGQPPELLVHVDTTAPRVKIDRVDLRQGGDGRSLVVAWRGEEDDFPPHPARLLVSRGPRGPWTSLAEELPASGRYALPLERIGADRAVYVRIEMRDTAGNLGAAQTPQPVVLHRGPPRMEVRDLEPARNDAAARGPRRYIFR
ncbi:MAG: hypothetical protein ACOC46_02205 [Pirellulales bacterium]